MQAASWNDLAKIFTTESNENVDPRAADNILIAWPEMVRMMPKNGAVLDFGCGTGAFAKKLKSLGHTVTGVDPAHEMIEIAKRAPEGVVFHEGSVDQLAQDAAFDAITSIMVFQFIPEKEMSALFSKLIQHLKPNGRLLFAVHNPDYVETARALTPKYRKDDNDRFFIQFKNYGEMELHLRTGDDYKRLLEPLGMQINEALCAPFTAEYVNTYINSSNEPLDGSKFLILSFDHSRWE